MTYVNCVQLTTFSLTYSSCKNSSKSSHEVGHCVLFKVLYDKAQEMEKACSRGTLGGGVVSPGDKPTYTSRSPDTSKTKSLSLGNI